MPDGNYISEISYGYCKCGCGQKTKLAPRTRSERGWVQGEPQPCLPRHSTNGIQKRQPVASTIPGVIGIVTSGNHIALIDECDSDLAQFNWIASGKEGRFYVYRSVRVFESERKTTIQIHRSIMERILGRKLQRFEEVDHHDLNPLNNRRSNLRLASKSQNMCNRGATKLNATGLKGVFWSKHAKGWRAMIAFEGKKYHLGCFDTPEEAHEAYKTAAHRLHGEFARSDNS